MFGIELLCNASGFTLTLQGQDNERSFQKGLGLSQASAISPGGEREGMGVSNTDNTGLPCPGSYFIRGSAIDRLPGNFLKYNL